MDDDRMVILHPGQIFEIVPFSVGKPFRATPLLCNKRTLCVHLRRFRTVPCRALVASFKIRWARV